MSVTCCPVQMSSSTYECLDIYKDSVDSTCDSVDSGIKVHRHHITCLVIPRGTKQHLFPYDIQI